MWTCPKCRSQVDDDFEVCWSCGTSVDGVEDPDFVTADEAEAIVNPYEEGDPPEPDDSDQEFAGVPIPDLVACHAAANTVEAKFIADRLSESGIPAIADEHDMNLTLGGLQPWMWGYGPRVRVRPDDLSRALAWVKDYKQRQKKHTLD